MKISGATWASYALAASSFVVTAALYDVLPQSIATHWDARGVPNGFMPKVWGAFVTPLIGVGVLLLFSVIPRLGPKGYGVERFRRVFDIIQASTMAFLLFVQALILLVAIGVAVPMTRVVVAAVGLLFMVLGNFMGKLTRNFFVGIRTPWTLVNDEVWLRTHRLGGKVFAIAGAVLVISGIAGWGVVPVVVVVVVAPAVPIVYSYVLYRRLGGNGLGPPESPRRTSA
jgi:uncharacterized membrane protein